MNFQVFALVCLWHFVTAYSATIIEDYLPEPCKKSDPDYDACLLKALNKVGPYALKGIPKYNIPKMDPLEIPELIINRTLNEFVAANAKFRDIRMSGLSKIWINELRSDLVKRSGEIKLTVPHIYTTMEYDATGILLGIPLENKGHFRGNFTDITLHFKGDLKVVERNDIKHFAIDNFKFKSRIGNGNVKLRAKYQQDQFAADLITTFFNKNSRQILDATNPLYTEAAADFYRSIFDYILGSIPAAQLLPE